MPAKWVLGVAVIYSVFAALVSFWFTQFSGLSLWTLRADPSTGFSYILLMNLAMWGSWALFAPLAFDLARRYPVHRETWRRALAVHLPASLVITGAHIVFVATARFALQNAWGVPAAWSGSVRDAFFRTLDFELPVYWLLVGVHHAVDYYREVRSREVAAAHLETRLIEAQLEALQRQLHPHFLFNTLHAISTLLHRDPTKADEMIERLSDLLRITLNKVGVSEVSLAEELEYVRAYLDIEQVHFGERLAIDYRIEAAALDVLVPNLVLQPLVENAVRHGLEPRAGVGRLIIAAGRDGDSLRLVVTDNGRGVSARGRIAAEGGIGLSNTRSRLDRLYGSAASLTISEPDGGGCEAQLTIPWRPHSSHEHSYDHRGRSAAGARTVDCAAG